MRPGLIAPRLCQLQQRYRYAPRSASSSFVAAACKDLASNAAIQRQKRSSNTAGVIAVPSFVLQNEAEFMNIKRRHLKHAEGIWFAFTQTESLVHLVCFVSFHIAKPALKGIHTSRKFTFYVAKIKLKHIL